MKYLSTRGHPERKQFCQILLEGLAPDGGLYLPESYPKLTINDLDKLRRVWHEKGYADLAFAILSLYIDDIPSADLLALCRKTYTKEVYGSDAITPLKELTFAHAGLAKASAGTSTSSVRTEAALSSTGSVRTEAAFYLEALSNGPTLAFKDMAMQLLGNLFEYELARRNETLNIFGATSGDTGSAAEYAMRGKRGVRVLMTSPAGRMSPFQQAQMFSLMDENIHNIAIEGVFDDCQDLVKAVSNDAAFKAKYKIGTVNSINWARLLAQVVYYFAGYFQATSRTVQATPRAPQTTPTVRARPVEAASTSTSTSPVQTELPKVSFCVPSGNFGNVCAGHVARMMGLPIETLLVATNENDVLDEFFKTGVYRVRGTSDTHETSSPSMDISKASNFERFVFDMLNRDGVKVKALFGDQLGQTGQFDLSANIAAAKAQYGFASGRSTHADRLATIKSTYDAYGVMIDTHTADGVKVAREFLAQHPQPNVPMIVLETALPIKFSATVKEAIGREPDRPAQFEGIEALPKRVVYMPADVAVVKAYIAKACSGL
ncbi:MAG: threonine synthase [Cytophagales bacterium]|nr:threonine synthase [Cytophagales bacterium]